MKKISNCNLEKLRELAASIAASLKPGDVICLRGDLGVGKTTFSQFLIKSLLDSEQEVTSPTFNLVHTYQTFRGMIWHFDLYRLKDREEVFELGIEDAFQLGISLIEWPEIIEDLLPKNAINIYLSFSAEEGRRDLEII